MVYRGPRQWGFGSSPQRPGAGQGAHSRAPGLTRQRTDQVAPPRRPEASSMPAARSVNSEKATTPVATMKPLRAQARASIDMTSVSGAPNRSATMPQPSSKMKKPYPSIESTTPMTDAQAWAARRLRGSPS